MANFINYKNIDFQLNNQIFYANRVSVSAQASTEAVVLSDGSLLNYSPDGAVVGSLSCDFYLTGSVPSFLNITGTSESAVVGRFAEVNITGLYPKSISFSVDPFEPILISAEFDWYGSVNVENFKEQLHSYGRNKAIPSYIANAYKSYISTDNIFASEPQIGNVTNFSYMASYDRPSFFYADEKIPFRVAKMNKRCEVEISSNSLGELIDIQGKNAVTTIYLKDFYGTLLDSFPISGVLNNQNYEISEGQYMLSKASISQTVTEQKTLI